MLTKSRKIIHEWLEAVRHEMHGGETRGDTLSFFFFVLSPFSFFRPSTLIIVSAPFSDSVTNRFVSKRFLEKDRSVVSAKLCT